MNIYVSNLSRETTEGELGQAFSLFGEVRHVIIMCTESSRGFQGGRFGYIEMAVKSEGAAAISSLNGSKIGGRVINLVEALPLSKKPEKHARKPLTRPWWTTGLNKIT